MWLEDIVSHLQLSESQIGVQVQFKWHDITVHNLPEIRMAESVISFKSTFTKNLWEYDDQSGGNWQNDERQH